MKTIVILPDTAMAALLTAGRRFSLTNNWIVNLGPYQCQESSFLITLLTLRITLQM
jgi:hypothetical protein